MADLDAWWTVNFAKFSIRDLQKLPIFQRFLQLHYPYERMMDTRRESFRTSEIEDVFVRDTEDRQESFTHNKQQREYIYVQSYPEKDCIVTVTSHTQGEVDWGQIVRKFDGWEVREAWRLDPPDREYEKFTVEKGITKGFRCGIKPRDGAAERWVEEVWESDDEKVHKKSWEKEGESGGESKTQKLGYTWGEEWLSNADKTDKKVWHEEATRKWGHSSGHSTGGTTWEHRWDMDVREKLEEKVTVTDGHALGYRFSQKGADWYKQEWQGEKSIPGDQDYAALGARFISRLQEVHARAEAAVANSDRTLRLMVAALPEMQDKVAAMSARLAAIQSPDRNNLDDLFTRISDLQGLETDQESLKQTLWEAASVEMKLLSHYIVNLHELADDSIATLSSLAQVVKMDSFDAKIVDAKKAVEGTILQPGLNHAAHMQKWQTVLASLETLKREHLKYACQYVPRRDVSELMEYALRRQDLEDAVKHVYILLIRSHEFVRDLSSIVGDEKLHDSAVELKKQFEATYNQFTREHETEQFVALLDNLKSHNALQVALLAQIRGTGEDPGRSQLISIRDTTDAATELMSLCVQMTRSVKALKMFAKDESEIETVLEHLSAGLESSDPTIEALSGQVKHLRDWGSLFTRLTDKMAAEVGGGFEAIKMLEPIISDLHQLAKESSSADQDVLVRLQSLQRESKAVFAELTSAPTDHESKKAVRLIRSYCLILRSAGVKADVGSPFVVLESVLSEMYAEAIEDVKGDVDSESSVHELKTALEAMISELLESPSKGNFSRFMTGIRGFSPISRSFALKTIEGLLPPIDKIVGFLSPEDEAQIMTFRLRVSDPLRDYKTGARPEHLNSVLSVLNEYKKLLETLPKTSKLPHPGREERKLVVDTGREASPKQSKSLLKPPTSAKTPVRRMSKK